MGYAFVLRDTSFAPALDILYALKGYVTCAVDTYFTAALDKLDKPDTIIGSCGFGSVGIVLCAAGGVGYDFGTPGLQPIGRVTHGSRSRPALTYQRTLSLLLWVMERLPLRIYTLALTKTRWTLPTERFWTGCCMGRDDIQHPLGIYLTSMYSVHVILE